MQVPSYHQLSRFLWYIDFMIGIKGFSLLEIAMALVILGILTALLSPEIIEQVERARRAQAFSQGNDLKQRLLEYQIDPLRLRPAQDRGTFHKTISPGVTREINMNDLVEDGYLTKYPVNPWRNKWVIRYETDPARDIKTIEISSLAGMPVADDPGSGTVESSTTSKEIYVGTVEIGN
ncbi:MAG: prepilin-type N-terminal cleavage/methylation domain-containing protein [Bacteroidales bacterium]|nr:prepilin-type N-terminal cleavage/methylation domain-containing protein [Bacteroidales bacterium]